MFLFVLALVGCQKVPPTPGTAAQTEVKQSGKPTIKVAVTFTGLCTLSRHKIGGDISGVELPIVRDRPAEQIPLHTPFIAVSETYHPTSASPYLPVTFPPLPGGSAATNVYWLTGVSGATLEIANTAPPGANNNPGEDGKTDPCGTLLQKNLFNVPRLSNVVKDSAVCAADHDHTHPDDLAFTLPTPGGIYQSFVANRSVAEFRPYGDSPDPNNHRQLVAQVVLWETTVSDTNVVVKLNGTQILSIPPINGEVDLVVGNTPIGDLANVLLGHGSAMNYDPHFGAYFDRCTLSSGKGRPVPHNDGVTCPRSPTEPPLPIFTQADIPDWVRRAASASTLQKHTGPFQDKMVAGMDCGPDQIP